MRAGMTRAAMAVMLHVLVRSLVPSTAGALVAVLAGVVGLAGVAGLVEVVTVPGAGAGVGGLAVQRAAARAAVARSSMRRTRILAVASSLVSRAAAGVP